MIKQEEIGKRIALLRKQRGYSQEGFAQKLDMPRTSLAQIELGNRNVSAGELLQISDFLEISIDYLLSKEFGLSKEAKVTKTKAKTEKIEERISVPDLNVEKFKQMLLYVLGRCAGKPNVGETVLNKLIYFIEFNYFERYEEHMIGAAFRKQKFGPVPIDMDLILAQMETDGQVQIFNTEYYGRAQKRFMPLADPDLTKINAAEIKVMDEVLIQLSDLSAKTISEYSHRDMPWKATQEGDVIDYELAFYREPPFSARVYDNSEPE